MRLLSVGAAICVAALPASTYAKCMARPFVTDDGRVWNYTIVVPKAEEQGYEARGYHAEVCKRIDVVALVGESCRLGKKDTQTQQQIEKRFGFSPAKLCQSSALAAAELGVSLPSAPVDAEQ